MPPILALLICTAFVLYLLRLETSQSRSLSSAIWVPAIWMMACASKPLASWFGQGGVDGVEAGSPLDRNFTTLVILAGLVIINKKGLDWRTIARNNNALVLIYVFSLVSIIWSEYPFVSIKRYIRFSGSVVMALVILTETDPRQAFESVLRRTAFVLIPFSFLLIKYYPPLGAMYGRWSGELMWVGMADQKNSFGILCFVSSFFLFWRVLKGWPTRKVLALRNQFYADCLVFVLALYLLKGPPVGYSATSIAVFVLGVAVMLGLLWLRKQRKKLGLLTMAGMVILLFLYGWGTPFGARNIGASFLELLGRDSSFTDRDIIWQELISVWSENPVFGRGYGGFWVKAIESDVNTPHNGYLGVMLELGVFGVLLVFNFVLSVCRGAWARLSYDFWWGSLGFCFLSMVVLHNTSEASFLKTSDFLWSLLVILSVILASAKRARMNQDQNLGNGFSRLCYSSPVDVIHLGGMVTKRWG